MLSELSEIGAHCRGKGIVHFILRQMRLQIEGRMKDIHLCEWCRIMLPNGLVCRCLTELVQHRKEGVAGDNEDKESRQSQCVEKMSAGGKRNRKEH